MRFGLVLEIILPVLFIAWASVMVFGATLSATGYRALAVLEETETALQANVERLKQQRIWMENRAELLQSAALDPDMVDERIRGVLGYARAEDMVISRADLRAALAMITTRIDVLPVSDSIAQASDIPQSTLLDASSLIRAR